MSFKAELNVIVVLCSALDAILAFTSQAIQWQPKPIVLPHMFSRPLRPPNALSLRWLVNLVAFVRWLARIIAASSANQKHKAPCWLFLLPLACGWISFLCYDWPKWVVLTFVLSPNKRCPQFGGWTLLAPGTTGSRMLLKWKRLKSISVFAWFSIPQLDFPACILGDPLELTAESLVSLGWFYFHFLLNIVALVELAMNRKKDHKSL